MKSSLKRSIGEVVTDYGTKVMKVMKKRLQRSLFDFYGDVKADNLRTREAVNAPTTPVDGDGGIIYTKSADGKLYYKSNEVSEVELSASDTVLTSEQVQDIVGAMVDGGTETNIAVTYDDSGGKLNFVSTDTNTTYSEATGSAEGLMSIAHHDKLDGIESGADVTDTANVTAAGALMDSELTDLSGVKGVTISTLQAKPSEGGFVNGDKTKLDGIEAGATADQTQADINGLGITAVGIAGATDGDVTITSDGEVTVKLDSDNDESNQKFKITNNADSVVFSVQEDGVVNMAGGTINIDGSNSNLELNSGSDFILEADNNGGSGASSIQYPDAGGTNRIMLAANSDVVILSNRASNGTVQIRANSSTAGGSGEVTVVTVEDDKVTISQDLDVTGNVLPGITQVKIFAKDFIPDDAGRPAMIDDTGSDRWLESHGTAKLFAYVDIPVGFKATHVDIYGSATSAVTVYEADVNSKTVTSKGTGNIGTQINITDVNSDATNYILIELAQASGEEVYGGKLTIAKI